MFTYISVVVSIALISLTAFFRYRFNRSKKIFFDFLLFTPLLMAPLFRYVPKEIYFYLLPFITLILLFLTAVTQPKTKSVTLIIGLAIILWINLLISGIIVFPLTFQFNATIFSDQHITDAIFQHQHDSLYIFYRLRPIIYNFFAYLYFALTQAVNFLSLKSLYDILLFVTLLPIIKGILKSIKNPRTETSFVLGCLVITFLVIGFSRSVVEIASLFIISPVLIYLTLLGIEGISLPIYLSFLILSLGLQALK